MPTKTSKAKGMAAERGAPTNGEPSAATGSPTGQDGTASAPSASGGSPAEECVKLLQKVIELWKQHPQEVGPVLGEFKRGIEKLEQQAGQTAPTSGQPAPAATPASSPAPAMAAQRGA